MFLFAGSCFGTVFPDNLLVLHFKKGVFTLWHCVLEVCNLFLFGFNGLMVILFIMNLKGDFEILNSVGLRLQGLSEVN